MYREPTREERTLLNRFFNNWGVFDYFKDRNILVKENEMRGVYLMSEKVKTFALEHTPIIAGLRLGDLRKNFLPSLECASIIAENSDRRKVVVNDKAAALVLYGRDIFGSSVVSHSDDFDENEIVLVTNKAGEVLAIGRTRFSSKLIQKDAVTITNIADRGSYLRDENVSSFHEHTL